MKRKTMLSSILLCMFCFSLIAEAGIKPRSAGIGFRGTFWRFNNDKPGFAVSNSPSHTEVNVGGGGGWLYLFSRIDNDWIFEFSLCERALIRIALGP